MLTCHKLESPEPEAHLKKCPDCLQCACVNACMHVCTPHAYLVPEDARRRHQSPWTFCHRWLRVSICVLGMEPRFSARAAIAPTPEQSLAPVLVRDQYGKTHPSCGQHLSGNSLDKNHAAEEIPSHCCSLCLLPAELICPVAAGSSTDIGVSTLSSLTIDHWLLRTLLAPDWDTEVLQLD